MIKIFSILSFFIGYISFSQTVQVTGVVIDTTQAPLEMASILALKDGNVENYAITNHEGRFKMNLRRGEKYILRANYLGMKPSETEIELTGSEDSYNLAIMLFTDENQLDGVEIKYEMPVVKRGDTLIYNADSFTNGTERKLGDVLKKMPGMNVNEKGDIEFEGKKVSKVMVDGKDFFDGDSKLATKNIPADAVGKVEVLSNYNEVSQMRGLGNDQDNVVINLKLKEGKTNFWFGEVEGGAGDGKETRYLGRSSLFYYSPKSSINILGNLNNTGDVPFTARDYFNFTGGMSSGVNTGTNINIPESDLRFLMMQNNRAKELESKFGALNFSHQLTNKWGISGFSIFNDGKTGFLQETIREFITTGITEISTSNTRQRNQLGLVKLSSVYKPHNRFQFDYDVLAKAADQREGGNVISVFSGEVNPIDEFKKNEPISVSQKANLYYTLNDKNIFAGYFNHLYQNEDPFYNAIVSLQPFPEFLPLIPDQQRYNINQDSEVFTNKIDLKLDYYFVLNKMSNFNISLGYTKHKQKYSSSMFQILDNNSVNRLEDEQFNNCVDYDLSDYFVGLRYKLKHGIFTITPGLSLHYYENINSQAGVETQEEKMLLLPLFIAHAQIKRSQSLSFNYRMTADFTDVNNLAEANVLSSYNRLFRGNRLLENAIFNTWSLNYSNFNMYNFTSIFAGINYNRRLNAIRNTTLIEEINLVTTPINSSRTDELLSVNANFEKTFRLLKTKLSTSQFLNQLQLVANEQPVKSRNFIQNYTGSVLTNFKKSPHFEVGYNRNISQNENGGITNIFITDKPFANVQVNFFEGFRFMAEWSYNNYRNKEKTITNEYSFAEATLSYQNPGNPWEFKLEGTNLFNVQSLNTSNFNEFFNSNTEFFVQPRIIMATVTYKL